MNSRERVLAAPYHEVTDRLSFSLRPAPGLEARLQERLPTDDWESALGQDIRRVPYLRRTVQPRQCSWLYVCTTWYHNGYLASFNGRLRDELLNRELFLSPPEARYVLDEWCEEYNQRRPHGGVSWRAPAAFPESLAAPSVGAPPLPAEQPMEQLHPILS